MFSLKIWSLHRSKWCFYEIRYTIYGIRYKCIRYTCIRYTCIVYTVYLYTVYGIRYTGIRYKNGELLSYPWPIHYHTTPLISKWNINYLEVFVTSSLPTTLATSLFAAISIDTFLPGLLLFALWY